MSEATQQHRSQAPRQVRCAVLTISDTRTLQTDAGGQCIVERLAAAGHVVVARHIVPDEPARIESLLSGHLARSDVQAILITGGTGVSGRDQTYETISRMLSKPLPGYGELFRMLSYQEIGAAAMLSRAVAGLVGRTVLLTMPGSPAGVKLAMDKLIIPELPHLVREAER